MYPSGSTFYHEEMIRPAVKTRVSSTVHELMTNFSGEEHAVTEIVELHNLINGTNKINDTLVLN